jgi:hypothetical protein
MKQPSGGEKKRTETTRMRRGEKKDRDRENSGNKDTREKNQKQRKTQKAKEETRGGREKDQAKTKEWSRSRRALSKAGVTLGLRLQQRLQTR